MRQSAVRFAQKELSEGVTERDLTESFSHDQWQACVQYGILGLSFPEVFGGTEIDSSPYSRHLLLLTSTSMIENSTISEAESERLYTVSPVA